MNPNNKRLRGRQDTEIGVRLPSRLKTFHRVDANPQPLSVYGMGANTTRQKFKDFFAKRGLPAERFN